MYVYLIVRCTFICLDWATGCSCVVGNVSTQTGTGQDYYRMLANYRCGGGKTRRAESARRRGSLPTKFIGQDYTDKS